MARRRNGSNRNPSHVGSRIHISLATTSHRLSRDTQDPHLARHDLSSAQPQRPKNRIGPTARRRNGSNRNPSHVGSRIHISLATTSHRLSRDTQDPHLARHDLSSAQPQRPKNRIGPTARRRNGSNRNPSHVGSRIHISLATTSHRLSRDTQDPHHARHALSSAQPQRPKNRIGPTARRRNGSNRNPS